VTWCGWQPRTAGEDGIEIDVLATHLEHRNEKVRLQQLIQCLSHVSPSRYIMPLSLCCVLAQVTFLRDPDQTTFVDG
jgi:hypothetical protein